MNVALLFGGKSAEHEISLRSARNIVEALDKDKFTPVLIGISKNGRWFLYDQILKKQVVENSNLIKVTPGAGNQFLSLKNKNLPEIDVAFPVLHGPNGEDGTIQGLFEMVGVPYVGPGVLSSAMAMDKVISKVLLKDKGLKVADYLSFRGEVDFDLIEKKFQYPLFVKPANLGSSVGVSKVRDRKELKRAVKEAFKYDKKILVEEFIKGREIECSVLGTKKVRASRVGEIKPKDFYSYKEKYSDKSSTELIIPAEIDSDLEEKIRKKAIEVFKILECQGMARVDFLVTEDEIYINEVNTIPGFTRISMYPKLWEETGLSYTDLITELLTLAVEEFKD